MKKTRIIIPALAMIAFSVAASITGTVAWFTANRTAQIDAGSYAVVKTSNDLTCSVGQGVGTTAANSGSTHTITVGGKLTDGSFDHAGTNKYIIAPDGSGTKVGKRTALSVTDVKANGETELLRGETSDSTPISIYTAITWDLTFTIQFGAATGDIGLFMNLATTTYTPSSETIGATNQDTAKGFRMAFIPQGATSNDGVAHVVAGLQTSSNCHYIGGEPAVGSLLSGSVTNYSGLTLIDSSNFSASATLAESYTQSAASGMVNYFGKFAFAANSSVELSYRVVCWFEGTDPNIVNGDTDNVTIFRDVTSHLEFSAINLTA